MLAFIDKIATELEVPGALRTIIASIGAIVAIVIPHPPALGIQIAAIIAALVSSVQHAHTSTRVLVSPSGSTSTTQHLLHALAPLASANVAPKDTGSQGAAK